MTSSAGGGASKDHSLQIMYGIGGEHDLTERELPHLRGHRDSAPVRIGNGAWSQTQNDVYGELLDSLHLYRERLGELHPEIQEFAAELADKAAAAGRSRTPGCGRCGASRGTTCPRRCSAGRLSTGRSSSPRSSGSSRRPRSGSGRGTLSARRSSTRGWSEERQAYAQTFESDDLDAAQLLMPLVGFLPATDERMRSTIEAIAARADRRTVSCSAT